MPVGASWAERLRLTAPCPSTFLKRARRRGNVCMRHHQSCTLWQGDKEQEAVCLSSIAGRRPGTPPQDLRPSGKDAAMKPDEGRTMEHVPETSESCAEALTLTLLRLWRTTANIASVLRRYGVRGLRWFCVVCACACIVSICRLSERVFKQAAVVVASSSQLATDMRINPAYGRRRTPLQEKHRGAGVSRVHGAVFTSHRHGLLALRAVHDSSRFAMDPEDSAGCWAINSTIVATAVDRRRRNAVGFIFGWRLA